MSKIIVNVISPQGCSWVFFSHMSTWDQTDSLNITRQQILYLWDHDYCMVTKMEDRLSELILIKSCFRLKVRCTVYFVLSLLHALCYYDALDPLHLESVSLLSSWFCQGQIAFCCSEMSAVCSVDLRPWWSDGDRKKSQPICTHKIHQGGVKWGLVTRQEVCRSQLTWCAGWCWQRLNSLVRVWEKSEWDWPGVYRAVLKCGAWGLSGVGVPE